MEDIEIFVPEFEYKKKNRMWYLCLIFISLLLILLALLSENYTFIAIILLSFTIITMRSMNKPEIVPFVISDKGIYLKNKFWGYEDIKNFSLSKIGSKNYFIFTPIGKMQTEIKIPVKKPEIIKQKLNNLLTEVEYQESLTDMLIRLTGL